MLYDNVVYPQFFLIFAFPCIHNGSKIFKTPTSHSCSYRNQYIHTVCIDQYQVTLFVRQKKISPLNFLHCGISIPLCMYNSYHYHFGGAPKKTGDGFSMCRSLSLFSQLQVIGCIWCAISIALHSKYDILILP